jgi:hypothetical protein
MIEIFMWIKNKKGLVMKPFLIFYSCGVSYYEPGIPQ